ncbi:MAG: DUF402 domain-containing protein [Acidimicrobiia bacterium]
MVEIVHVDERKWPDGLHWQFDAVRLGDDEHGVWLYVPEETVARRGHEPPRQLRSGFVGLVPEEEWWMVEYYWDHPWHEIYVNIGTPPEWNNATVRQVDLDLDVVRKVDGSVEVLDEDEFAEHQVKYEYPTALVTSAHASAERASVMLTEREEPFGVAVRRWMRRARRG